MRKVYEQEWRERYENACDNNLLLVIEYLLLKKKELDEKGYFEEKDATQ